jgi:hypothetical protein
VVVASWVVAYIHVVASSYDDASRVAGVALEDKRHGQSLVASSKLASEDPAVERGGTSMLLGEKLP